MNSIHDIGGMDGMGSLHIEENEPVFHEPWEGRIRAQAIIAQKTYRLFKTFEFKYVVDRMDPVFYLSSSYYQRWLFRFETILKEKGVITEEEIEKKQKELSPSVAHKAEFEAFRKVNSDLPPTQRNLIQTTTGTGRRDDPIQPKYSIGDPVQVKMITPMGHTRIPRYVRGKRGLVVRYHGNCVRPDVQAHQGKDLYQPIYVIRFDARELWGEDAPPQDKLELEIWEDYLEIRERSLS